MKYFFQTAQYKINLYDSPQKKISQNNVSITLSRIKSAKNINIKNAI